MLCTPGAWPAVPVLDVRLHGTRRPAPAAEALPEQLQLHIGAAAVPVRVRPLGPDTARLRLARPLPLRIGDRVVLRDPGRRDVAAGATALDVAPPPLRRRGAAARRAGELAGMGPAPDAAAELARRGLARRPDLVAMGVPAADVDALARGRRPAPPATGWSHPEPDRAPSLERLRAAVAAHDAADPLDPGLPLEAARRAVELPDAAAGRARCSGPRPTDPGLLVRDGRVRRPAADGAAGRSCGRPWTCCGPTWSGTRSRAPDVARLAELGLGPRQLASLVRAGRADAARRRGAAAARSRRPGRSDRAGRARARRSPSAPRVRRWTPAAGSRCPLLELLARTGRTVRTSDGGHRLA